jgi:hypothetical protein
MTLRQALGGDAQKLHELIDQFLDGENSLIVLFDGRRAISYGEGFGLSGCQLELVTIEMERALRAMAGTEPIKRRDRRTRLEQVGGPDDRAANGNRRIAPGPVLRLAGTDAAADCSRTRRPSRTGQGSVGERHASNKYNDVSGEPAVQAVGGASRRRAPTA